MIDINKISDSYSLYLYIHKKYYLTPYPTQGPSQATATLYISGRWLLERIRNPKIFLRKNEYCNNVVQKRKAVALHSRPL